ncbi:hypothetical protein V8D89_006304 [Ganoderma adspersum]
MPGKLRSRCHDLPKELTDAIIDHLHDDRPSLQACALVCSAWLDPSRYHLFRSLTVSQYGLLKSTVDFLISCPDVACYVERFIILGEEITNLSLKWDHFSLLLSRLPRLRVLHLTQFVLGVNRTGFKGGEVSPPLPLLKCPPAGPVEEIHIDTSNLVTYDFAILLHFLALFSSIRRLSLTVGRIRLLHEDGIPGLGARAPAHIALRELRTSDIPLPVVAKFVTETRTAETLRVLWFNDVLVWWTDEDVELLGRIFAALGRHGNLRKLIFGPIPILVPPPYGYPPLHMLDAAPVPNPPWLRLNLGHLDGLVELTLRTHILLPLHAALIGHLPRSVSRVHVALTRFKPRTDGRLWAAFDAAFAAPRFAGITLIVDLSACCNNPVALKPKMVARAKAHVEAALANVREQGRLVVEVGETQRAWWPSALALTMEHPEREIAHVVHLLTTSTDPEVQKEAVEKYYAPDVHFRHPVCEANDRKSLLSIFQWYRIMSPSHTLDVGSVTYNRDKLEVFLEITQTFHLRWSPLSPGPARLVTHLKLRPEKDKATDKNVYVIAAHEDFYQQADLAMLVAPPLVPLVRAALSASTLACRALTFGFSNVLGYWRVPPTPPTAEGGPEGTEGEHEKEGGKGAGTGAKGHGAGGNGNRRKKQKKNGHGGYAEAAREAVGEMQDKGLNAI